MDKLEEVSKWSDYNKVKQMGNKYNMDILLSTRKDKKYMVKFGSKYIHFGQMGYKDFTLTNDENKKRLFKLRNARWVNADKFTPAWLSYYILWT